MKSCQLFCDHITIKLRMDKSVISIIYPNYKTLDTLNSLAKKEKSKKI